MWPDSIASRNSPSFRFSTVPAKSNLLLANLYDPSKRVPGSGPDGEALAFGEPFQTPFAQQPVAARRAPRPV